MYEYERNLLSLLHNLLISINSFAPEIGINYRVENKENTKFKFKINGGITINTTISFTRKSLHRRRAGAKESAHKTMKVITCYHKQRLRTFMKFLDGFLGNICCQI